MLRRSLSVMVLVCALIMACIVGAWGAEVSKDAAVKQMAFYAGTDNLLGKFEVRTINGIEYVSFADLCQIFRQSLNMDIEYTDRLSKDNKVEYFIKAGEASDRLIFDFKDNVVVIDKQQELPFGKLGIRLEAVNGVGYFPLCLIGYVFFDNGIQLYRGGDSYFILNMGGLLYQVTSANTILKDGGQSGEMNKETKIATLLYFLALCKKYYPGLEAKNINIEKLKEAYLDKIAKTEDNTSFYNMFNEVIEQFKDDHVEVYFNGYSIVKTPKEFVASIILGDVFPERVYLSFKADKLNVKWAKEDYELLEINDFNVYDFASYKRFKESKAMEDFNEWINDVLNRSNARFKVYSIKLANKEKQIITRNYAEILYTKELDAQTGYIYIPTFLVKSDIFISHFNAAVDQFKDKQAVIVDIRGNGGGYTEICDYIPQYFVKESFLRYNLNSRTEIKRETENYLHGKIILLTDKKSYSASNTIAALFKTNKMGVIIGEKSGGGGYLPLAYVLPDDTVMLISSGIILTDKHGNDFENGVEPDIEVKNELVNGKDRVLEAAMEYIKKNVTSTAEAKYGCRSLAA